MDTIQTYHVGEMLINRFRTKPEDICQIDAVTGQKETKDSVLARSVRLAKCFRRFGLKPGDVVALGGKNHLDLHIPLYAALFNGLAVTGVDPIFKFDEIKSLLKLTQPKIAFCEMDSCDWYVRAARDLGLNTKVVTFDTGECTMNRFIEMYDDHSSETFKPATIDTDKKYAFLVSTSGTTGTLKLAALTHRVVVERITQLCMVFSIKTDHMIYSLFVSPVNWISHLLNSIALPIMNQCKVQFSVMDKIEYVIDAISTYKPRALVTSPSMMALMLQNTEKEVDLSSFQYIMIAGGKLYADLAKQIKARLREGAFLLEGYGLSETLGPIMMSKPGSPLGCCGRPMPNITVKLVDPDTGKEINEARKPGELWVKGGFFTEYYGNPKETANVFTNDGYLKTGDMLFRDENDDYYFVERMKSLIKYRSSHILPSELEDVIRSLPSVLDVHVTSVPDPVDGERPVACVVRKPDALLTAQDVKDAVAGKLSKNKHLTGGVVFLDKLPLTSNGKLAQSKLKQILLSAHRE